MMLMNARNAAESCRRLLSEYARHVASVEPIVNLPQKFYFIRH